jgi:oligopeptide transport system substrate-binding protein
MVKIFFYTTVLLAVLFSCNNPSSKDEAIIQVKSGGEITIPLNSYFKVTKPTRVVKIESAQINGQVLESLVKYNAENLQIVPALAEKWELSEDGLTYIFFIRKNVKFHNNKCFHEGLGREVITQDIVDMFYRVYKNELSNTAYSMFQNTIVGGDAYYEGSAESISGIQFDENTVSVTLVELSNTFLSKLITVYGSIVPNEVYLEDNYALVGTGPFMYDNVESNSELVVLNKNDDYWMKDSNGVQLPYLNKLSFKYYENDDERMDDFWSNDVAIVKNVPITKVSEVLEERIADFKGKNAKFILESVPEMATSYLEFNMRSEIFNDPRVRQAISLAIDRKKLVEKTLKNQAYEIGKFGITPPLPKIYEGYDFETIEKSGYTLNSVRAKELLAEAGYPNGENFPELTAEFKMDTDRYLIMSEIQNQLKSVLNINMAIEQVEFNKLLENISIGSADIFQQVWVGDFTSPESFLINYYGKIVPEGVSEPSLTNGGRYINEKFDELFEKGLKARTINEANNYFAEAEVEVLRDPALVVLFYGETLWLKQAGVKNFFTNGMNYLDFTNVYIQKLEAEVKK